METNRRRRATEWSFGSRRDCVRATLRVRDRAIETSGEKAAARVLGIPEGASRSADWALAHDADEAGSRTGDATGTDRASYRTPRATS